MCLTGFWFCSSNVTQGHNFSLFLPQYLLLIITLLVLYLFQKPNVKHLNEHERRRVMLTSRRVLLKNDEVLMYITCVIMANSLPAIHGQCWHLQRYLLRINNVVGLVFAGRAGYEPVRRRRRPPGKN